MDLVATIESNSTPSPSGIARSRRFSVAPMMDWTDITKSDVYSEA